MSYTVACINPIEEPEEWSTFRNKIETGDDHEEVSNFLQTYPALVHHVQLTVTSRFTGPTINYRSALCLAALCGRVQVVRLLIREAASVKQIPGGFPEDYPLYLSVQKGHSAVVQVLIEEGACMEVRIPSKNSMTIFSFAVRESELEMVKMMLSKGADVNSKDKDGDSPLTLALLNKEENADELLRELVSYDADGSCLTNDELDAFSQRYQLADYPNACNAFTRNIIALSKIFKAHAGMFHKAFEGFLLPSLSGLVLQYLAPQPPLEFHSLAEFYESAN